MVDSNDDSLQKALSVKLSEVKNQGNQVRSLIREVRHRQDEARFRYSALKLEKASIKKDLQATGSGGNGGGSGNKEALHQAMVNTQERRLFYILSFKIYGGVAGLYDYGPPGCAVKANVLGFWREHFVLEENMLEVDCTCVTPEVVLKASDHVEKFTDLMVKDEATGNCYRADHLLKDFCKDKLEKDLIITSEMAQELKEVLSQLNVLSAEELGACIKKYGITAPDIKNSLSDPYHNNSVSMGKRRGKGSKKRRLGKYQCGRSKKIRESSVPKTAAILTDDKSACNVAEATSSSHADMNTRERVLLIERGR